MKVAVLSNINFSYLAKNYDDIYVAGISEYYNELILEDSHLNKNYFDVVFYFLDVEENLEYFSNMIDQLYRAISSFIEKHNKTLFVMSSFFYPHFDIYHYLKNNNNNALIDSFNNKLKSLNSKSNFYFLDFNLFLSKYGYRNIITPNYWYLGRIKYSLEMANYLLNELKNIYNAYRGNIKKVLIVDLDNTLWGGVLGEDGINGIKLSEDGEGKIYRDFQKNIKKLKELGVILCVASKNNLEDVTEVFRLHPMMALSLDDFIIKKINWNPKPENIKEIANELNLGIDSFVFIDDSVFERNLVREVLPECIVPEFPSDITYLNIWFYEEVVYKYFPKLNITDEDKEKNEQYLRNFLRENIKNNLTFDEYIKQLEIKLTYYINDDRFISRMAQLTQKTNQFNLTTKRYTESDMIDFMRRDDTYIFALEYEDRFGKEGIVGLAIVFLINEVAKIDTFLMSCRIIGRKVEFDFINYIIEYFSQKGIKRYEGEYISTSKNIIVKNFYKECGFVEYEENKYIKEI